MSIVSEQEQTVKPFADEGGDVEQGSKIKHDTFDKDGRWSPPGGRVLYFHSGLSEVADGLESDGLQELDPATEARVMSIVKRMGDTVPGHDVEPGRTEELERLKGLIDELFEHRP